MKEYQKIETLFKFDETKKRFVPEINNPIVKYLQNLSWLGSEKIDGTNIRIHWDGKSFEFGGRTDNAEIPKAVMEILTNKFDYEMEILFEQTFGNKDVYVFCEAYGGKIQNGAYSCDTSLIGYDIMVDNIYLDRTVTQNILKKIDIQCVPFIIFRDLNEAIEFVQEREKSLSHPQDNLEGVVCVPTQRIYDHMGNRVIVKIKKRDLLKTDF